MGSMVRIQGTAKPLRVCMYGSCDYRVWYLSIAEPLTVTGRLQCV